jgi:hypothetical protein
MRVKRRTRTAVSDNDAAQRLNDAPAILFKTIFIRSKTAA